MLPIPMLPSILLCKRLSVFLLIVCRSLSAAAAARADGIQFVSVGVGGGVDAEFLGSLGEYYAGTVGGCITQLPHTNICCCHGVLLPSSQFD